MLTSAVIYKQSPLHEKEIVQLLLNCKCYGVALIRFRKPLQSSAKKVKNIDPETTRSFLPAVQFVASLNCYNFFILIKLMKLSFLENTFLKTGWKKTQFYSHLVRSNARLKFLNIYVLWRCFLKNKTCLNYEYFIIKKYRQRSFRSDNFNYERLFFLESRWTCYFVQLILK